MALHQRPEAPATFGTFCDALALVYHESRNVRHLVRGEYLDSDPWQYLVSLPRSRDAAWREVAPLRDEAKASGSVDSALKVFEVRFRVSLTAAAEMLADENWRHAKFYGGNAWARISQLTISLARALAANEAESTDEVASKLMDSQHNTGSVRDKLSSLDRGLRDNRP